MRVAPVQLWYVVHAFSQLRHVGVTFCIERKDGIVEVVVDFWRVQQVAFYVQQVGAFFSIT